MAVGSAFPKTTHVTRFACLLGLILIGVSLPARAQTETVLHEFGTTPTDGYQPTAPLLIDGSGNLFGTTTEGSETLCDLGEIFGCGIVFELVKSNSYSEEIVYSFGTSSPVTDGASPQAGLIADAAGNLYGTTTYGGSANCTIDIGADGCGTVFELVKSSTGYTENVLYAFTGYDGAYPYAGLAMDSSGNLYGTTQGGGGYGWGTVFELVHSSGSYTDNVLYSFGGTAGDAASPIGGLLIDASGNLFGTTEGDIGPFDCGGTSCGTVFELTKSSTGYTERVLYQFTGSDGANPQAGLIMDSSGNLYGTTSQGGAYGQGTVFELVNSSGSYTEKVLYSFAGGADGSFPIASLLIDSSGDLFGTSKMGGSTTACDGYGCGTVFELVNSSGTYTERLLHGFGGFQDGSTPAAALVMDNSGNLYGTTAVGGSNLQNGIVFQVNPTAPASDATLSAASLSFSYQVVNTTSPVQSITVTNTGKANLIFGADAVMLLGPQAADFAINTDLCSGATIPPNATCAVSVTFTPSLPTTETASLTFTDNGLVGSQTVSLVGTGVPNAPVATLSPANLTFPAQMVSTNSATQEVTLTNEGGALLSITGISVTANFDQTNNCGSSLATGANCTINVSFAPTAGGQLQGTLSIADNASGSPQAITLLGTGEDFAVGTAQGSPQSIIVSPGATANYSVNVVPLGGFNQTVTLACAGAPSLATCSLSPASAMLDGTDAVPVTVSVTTTAATLIVPLLPNSPIGPRALGLFATLILGCISTFWLAASRRKTRAARIACLALIALTVPIWISCGSGGSSPHQGSPGTPSGTYTLTVTATSGNLTHSTVLTLTVN
jgi:uncharacterized repeat protein (TIGR03803 family)